MNMHRPDPLVRRVAALTEQNETLREEVRQLRELLSPPILPPLSWGLTRSETRLLSALRAAGPRVLSRERAIAAICDRFDDLPGPKLIDAHVSRIRTKLRRAGQSIRIQAIYYEGYRLTPESLAALNLTLTPDSERGASPLDQGAVR